METKTETRKPGINRVRRQLLLGAGLAPVVVTLHAAKVFAAGELDGKAGVSGIAPFSGVIEGSTTAQGTPANAEAEPALYKAIHDETVDGSPLANYYGGIGSSSGTYAKGGTHVTWSYNNASTDDSRPGDWSQNFEAPFVAKVEEFQLAIDDIYTKADSTFGLTTDPVLAVIAELDLMMTDNSEDFGVYEYVNSARSTGGALNTAYLNAKTYYNQAAVAANTAAGKNVGDEGYIPSI